MKKLVLLLLILTSSNFITAQNDGDVDPSFTIGESAYKDGIFKATAIQSDGKILAVGSFIKHDNTPVYNIVRLNTDGTRDSSFNLQYGLLYIPLCLKIQSDGKILVGSRYETTAAGVPVPLLQRLNTDGTLDTTFNAGGFGPNGNIVAMEVQTDGKIIIGGAFSTYNGVNSVRFARLNIDGTLDASFNIGSGFINGEVSTLALQADGKIIAGGSFTSFAGTASRYICRINADGSRDTLFNIGTGFNNAVVTVKVQADNKIVAGGRFTTFNSTTSNYIARLNSDGTKDVSFTGTGSNGNVVAVNIQSDGKIIAGGGFTLFSGSAQRNLVRLNTDGTIDTNFIIGTGVSTQVNTISTQSDGKIILGGEFTTYNSTSCSSILRLNTDASLDVAFTPGMFKNREFILVECMTKQNDGKIIIAGNFRYSFGYRCGRIARLNADGTRDTTFNSATGASSTIRCLAVQSNNKILVGGDFASYNGNVVNCIVRLNEDGTTDTSFVTGTGFSGQVNGIAIQSDGKILVAGAYSGYNGVISNTRRYLVRLNTDGSFDTTFNPGGNGFPDGIGLRGILLQPNGKILIYGPFQNAYNSTPVAYVTRLNSDGTLDATFNNIDGINSINPSDIYDLAVLPNGNIIAVGIISANSGSAMRGMVMLNPTGSVIPTFNSGYGFDGTGDAIGLQSDGKIVIGGLYTTYNGSSAKNIIRLNPDGSQDNSFDTGSGFDYPVSSILTIEDNLLIGGSFIEYNGTEVFGIIKLQADNQLSNTDFSSSNFSISPNPAKDFLNVTMLNDTVMESYEIYNVVGQKVISANAEQQSIDVSELANGVYIIKLKSNNGSQNIKFIKS